MLDLRAAHRVSHALHSRFEDETLPPELSRAAFNRFDARAYSDDQRGQGLGAWQARVLDEYRSQVAFTDLLENLTTGGYAFDLVGACVRVVRDELRHVELCRRFIVALGGDEVIGGEPATVNPSRRLKRSERVLHTAVNFLCIGETLSMRLLAAMRSHTRDPLAHALVTMLTRDESIHSQFGFVLLETLLPSLSADHLKHLRREVPKTLRAVEEPIRRSGEGSADEAVNPFGVLSTERRLEVYRASVADDLVPAFIDLGILPKRRRPKAKPWRR